MRSGVNGPCEFWAHRGDRNYSLASWSLQETPSPLLNLRRDSSLATTSATTTAIDVDAPDAGSSWTRHPFRLESASADPPSFLRLVVPSDLLLDPRWKDSARGMG